jgi:hypothetical protein
MNALARRVFARGFGYMAVGCAVCSCSSPLPPVGQGATAAPPPVSYDGHYEGVVQVASAASSTDPRSCATEPHVSFVIRNNRFIYAQQHPKVAGTAPGLTASATTAVYNAAIAPDGTITGNSGDGGTMVGQATGGHITGQINGLLCGYTFTADRAASTTRHQDATRFLAQLLFRHRT